MHPSPPFGDYSCMRVKLGYKTTADVNIDVAPLKSIQLCQFKPAEDLAKDM